jgi:hypothetical protein
VHHPLRISWIQSRRRFVSRTSVWIQRSALTRGAVEYGDECFCSNSYSGPVTAASASDCNMPCTGDSTKTCGAGNRAQIYTNPSAPAAAAALPSGWRLSVPCAQDGPDRIFAGYDPQTVSNLTPAKCIAACLVCIFYSCLDPALANSRWQAAHGSGATLVGGTHRSQTLGSADLLFV